jgi:outer membrane protein W
MKTTRIIIFALLGLFAVHAHAQYSIGFNCGPAFPMSRYSGDMKLSMAAANLKINKHVDDYLRVSLGAGYYMVPFKSLNIDGVQKEVSNVNLTLIPVTLGGQFFFGGIKWKPYISLDLGYVLTIQDKSAFTKAANRNNFIIAPALGINYMLSDDFALNLGVKNNVIIYQFRDIEDSNEAFQLLALELGINYKF